MGRGLTRSVSKASRVDRKRTRTQSVDGELVEIQDTFEEEQRDESIDEPSVLDKYKASARIANAVIEEVLQGVVPGASACQLCRKGDQLIADRTNEVYRKAQKDGRPVERGIAFPTCVSVNEVACHFSPLETEPDIVIKAGDMVRVELSTHIDGYITPVAHTIVVPGTDDVPERDSVIAAAYLAADGALRLMRPGQSNDNVTQYINTVAHSYGVTPCRGVLSHRMARFEEQGHQIIIGKSIIAADDSSQLAPPVTFVENSVWSLDICMITGSEDRLRQLSNYTTTIFKRSEVIQNVRLKAANYVLRELRARGRTGSLPCCLYWFDDQLQARFGLTNLKQHQLVDSFPVLCTKPGQYLARFKWTVLIHNNRVERITGLSLPEDFPLQQERLHPAAALVLSGQTRFDPKTGQPRKVLRAKRQRLEAAHASTTTVE